jgi:hypothetical protein
MFMDIDETLNNENLLASRGEKSEKKLCEK